MKHLIGMILLGVVALQTAHLATMVHPVTAHSQTQNQLQIAAIKIGLGDPGEKILMAIAIASKQTGLSQELLLSLMYSESSFNPKAISSKQYQGLMQIPKSNLLLHKEEDVNTLIGAKILIEKLAITKGDMKTALILYKGWELTDPKGKQQAEKVLSLARRLREV